MDAASICSLGSSYLTNSVEALYGHAASRDIASDPALCSATIARGQKFLTADAHGSNGKTKPYRWVCYRWVSPEELVASHRRCENAKRLGLSKGGGKKGKKGKQGQQAAGVVRTPTLPLPRIGEEGGPQSSSSTSSDARNRFPSREVDGHGKNDLEELKDGVWHKVIRDISSRIVVSAHFATNLDVVRGVIAEKFDLLVETEEDDPEILRAAVQDASFLEMLKMYFETGDQDNPRFFHTLAAMPLSCFNGQTLLHFCCEKGLVECVRFLITEHATCTTNQDAPWLQWAHPLFQEKLWGNSSFSIACYRADAEMLGILLDNWWSKLTEEEKKGQDGYFCDVRRSRTVISPILVERMVDRKGFTLIEMLAGLIEKRVDPNERRKLLACYDLLETVCPYSWKKLDGELKQTESCAAENETWVDGCSSTANGGSTAASESKRYTNATFPYMVVDTKTREMTDRLTAQLDLVDGVGAGKPRSAGAESEETADDEEQNVDSGEREKENRRSRLSLNDLTTRLDAIFRMKGKSDRHTDLLICNVSVVLEEEHSSGAEENAVGQLFEFFRAHEIRTVNFKDCTCASITLFAALISGLADELRNPSSPIQAFEFPQTTFYREHTASVGAERTESGKASTSNAAPEEPEDDGRISFRPALLKLHRALVETFGTKNFYNTNIGGNWDIPLRSLKPSSPLRDSIPFKPGYEILRMTALKKTITAELGCGTYTIASGQRGRLTGEKEMNFFLKDVDSIDRTFLRKPLLLDHQENGHGSFQHRKHNEERSSGESSHPRGQHVLQEKALSPFWISHVRSVLQLWSEVVPSIDDYVSNFFATGLVQHQQVDPTRCREMAECAELKFDHSCVFFLKLRPKNGRPGLPEVVELVRGVVAKDPMRFMRAVNYLKSRKLDQDAEIQRKLEAVRRVAGADAVGS